MISKLFTPIRYQLKKEGVLAVRRGHPWIFRSQLSSAVQPFKNGQWLRLYDSQNEVIGYGIFESEGLIAIRVLKQGDKCPDTHWIQAKVDAALKKREPLREYTDAFRAIHGENDGLPGIVVDVYGTTGVLQTYVSSVDPLGRYVASVLASKLGLSALLWKLPTKRKKTGREFSVRWLRKGNGLVRFKEGKLHFQVDVEHGQKSGTFLDLRGLRKWLAQQKLQKKSALNLFAYTGMIGLALEAGGSNEITQVDIAGEALEFAKRHNVRDAKNHTLLTKNIFEWVHEIPKSQRWDVIIVDPPMMASRTEQVPKAIAAYRALYKALVPHLNAGGVFVACCCTSRIPRRQFQTVVASSLPKHARLIKNILPEDDHPVKFAEGDYLKVLAYQFTAPRHSKRVRPNNNFQ